MKELQDVGLWIVQRFRVSRHKLFADVQIARKTLGVAQEPSFDLANGYAKAHVFRRRGYHRPDQQRGAGVVVKVEDDHPGSVPGSLVVSRKSGNEVWSATTAEDWPRVKPCVSAESANDGFVEKTLDGCG